jgi:predicted DNA-binding transcriptional regulator AlpA
MLEALHSLAAGDFRKLLPPELAAEMLGVSKASLAHWRCDGTGPVFVKIGGRVGYDPSDLRSWIEARRRSTTARAA